MSNGKKYKYGVISLPTFYIDFAAARKGDPNYKSTTRDVKKLIAEQDWKVNEKKGVLFLPIHRFPKKMRKLVFGMDEAFSRSWFKNYSSYIMQCVVKV